MREGERREGGRKEKREREDPTLKLNSKRLKILDFKMTNRLTGKWIKNCFLFFSLWPHFHLEIWSDVLFYCYCFVLFMATFSDVFFSFAKLFWLLAFGFQGCGSSWKKEIKNIFFNWNCCLIITTRIWSSHKMSKYISWKKNFFFF